MKEHEQKESLEYISQNFGKHFHMIQVWWHPYLFNNSTVNVCILLCCATNCHRRPGRIETAEYSLKKRPTATELKILHCKITHLSNIWLLILALVCTFTVSRRFSMQIFCRVINVIRKYVYTQLNEQRRLQTFMMIVCNLLRVR